jgi:SSS family transporter
MDRPLLLRARPIRASAHHIHARGEALTPLLAGITAYVVLQLVIGVVASRRITTEDDYLVAGRSLGPVLATFTVFATWFGAESLISAAGSIYNDGLSGGSADPFGYGVCIVLTGLLLAIPLWRLKLTTLADLFRIRFDPVVERIAVVLMVPTSVFWAAAQVRAFGQVLSAASGFEVEVAVTLAAAIVIAYTIFGGLLADAWTDLVQGISLLVGLGAMFVAVVRAEGFATLAAVDPTMFRPLGDGSRPVLAIVEDWAIPVVGSLVAAEVVARMIAARSPRIARNATVVAGCAYLLIGLVPVVLGLMGSVLVPDLTESEQILPVLADRYLPTFLAVMFSGALVSAILSTVDSALLVAAGLVSHNVVVQLRPGMTDRQKVRVARTFVAVFGILAYLMAFRAERIYELVEQASAFGSSGIVVVVMFGLFTRFGDARSAVAALLVGVGSWMVGAYVLDLPYPYLTSLAMATLAYVVPAVLMPAEVPVLEPIEA